LNSEFSGKKLERPESELLNTAYFDISVDKPESELGLAIHESDASTRFRGILGHPKPPNFPPFRRDIGKTRKKENGRNMDMKKWEGSIF
jgi:hypothetical protein